jgi:hypothetical protein
MPRNYHLFVVFCVGKVPSEGRNWLFGCNTATMDATHVLDCQELLGFKRKFATGGM